MYIIYNKNVLYIYYTYFMYIYKIEQRSSKYLSLGTYRIISNKNFLSQCILVMTYI